MLVIKDNSYRLLNHGPTTLITTAHAGKRNIMAAAWVCALDFNPPKVTVVIDRKTYTRETPIRLASSVMDHPQAEIPAILRLDGLGYGYGS